ncbi:MAG: peptidyl-prolyl cis-trans isomerase A (cyclophilin A) [Myxococcota bacterium]|jgi:peptidyl-prolyl cis-trans isomerase A (cyclophilin A)
MVRLTLACLLGLMIAVQVEAQSSGSDVAPAVIEIETGAGLIVVELDTQNAPRTSANFLRYVATGLFDGGAFYRAVRLDNQSVDDVTIEVIQGGINRERRDEAFDPIPMEGTGATGLLHLDGTLSMARAGPDSARGEFFICLGDQPGLDEGGARNPDGRGFAAFGRVIEGMDVVRRIHRSETEGQRLVEPVWINSVRMLR